MGRKAQIFLSKEFDGYGLINDCCNQKTKRPRPFAAAVTASRPSLRKKASFLFYYFVCFTWSTFQRYGFAHNFCQVELIQMVKILLKNLTTWLWGVPATEDITQLSPNFWRWWYFQPTLRYKCVHSLGAMNLLLWEWKHLSTPKCILIVVTKVSQIERLYF